MTLCSACGQENPEGARFCLACGSALTLADAPRDERRVVSVIFVDLAGHTARSERLDPEDVRALLAPYHERVRREIESFGGVVEKFIGDAVMGVFGAPLAHGDDAERAVRAALVVRDAAGELADGGLQLRIAVNTGEAMVAGDVVNTAARLQAAAPLDGVVVGEATYRATRDTIEYQQTDPVVAKGKELPVPAWIALRATTEAGLRPVASMGIVGRRRELTILDALWERSVAEGLPHLVSIFGPSGVGKSTVAAEFARNAAGVGARVVTGRSLPYRESSTYGALAGQVLKLGGGFESDAAAVVAEKLQARTTRLLVGTEDDPVAVAGHLGVIVGLDTGLEASDREALFRSVRSYVEAASREQPTVLVFEDIHWANANMLDLVHALVQRIRGPVLFLTLSRPELLDARSDWGAGLAGYT